MKRLFKRSLSMLGVLVMVFTMLPAGMVSVSADTTDFDLPAGYTLQAISTVDELKAIQTGSAAKKVYYYLANNIEITSDTFGIGSNETTDAFWDILDGNGYAITFSGSTGNGVALNGNGIWNGGLFFAMNGDAVVKNLTIKGVITSSAKSVGAIVGQMVSGTIDHCVNHADIQSPQESAGGLAGRVKEGVVVNCMNYGDITGAAFTGGIVGSVSYATAMTEDEIAAGVVKAVIANCANFGTVTGAEKVGGIIGLGSKDKSYRIDNCYNAGSVPEPSLTKDRVGAIVCSAWSGAVITNNCYALENSSPKMLSTTTKMTQAEMQAASFADTLNANVTTGISYINTVGGTSVIVPAVAWQANEGEYPTIPAVTPIIPKADLTEEEQMAMDGDQWSDAVTVSQGTGSTETATIATNARYLRLVLNQSNGTGYDVAELAVYGVAVSDMNPDKAALKKAIDLYVRSDVYTKDSYAAYQEALAAATNIYASEKVTQKQVDAALEDLNTAYAALTFRDFGEVLATVKGQTVNVGSRQTISVNWTQLDKSLDLSGEDLDKIYLFATVDITSDTEAAGMFGNGRVLLRSPNTTKEDGGSQENNAWVNTNTMLTQLGRNVLYFPLSQLVNQTGTMDWSQVQTFRMYIDSMNQFDGNKTMVLGDVQIIRTTEPTKVKVACVGDSITAGVGASATSQNYVSQLQKLLGTGYVVQNFGNSGKTLLKDAAGGNGYVLTDTYQKSIDFEPDVVTIMLGTNDSKDENWNTLSGNYEQELRNLITTYRNLPSHPIVILATSPTAYNRNWNINDAVITDEIAPIQRKVAEEMGCPLIETNANTKNMADNFADGIHPNDGGHTVLAELFADGITDAATRIYSFELAGQTATVDHDKGTIAVTLSADADVTDLTPTIGLMMSATVSPAGSMDFTDSVTLTVTAPDGENTREYLVTVTKETGTILLGDVNLNGEVTAEDALMALQAATDKIALTADQTTAANVDETDDVTAGDALLILQYATKKIASF